MTIYLIGGLVAWLLAGCVVAAILCLLFHAVKPRSEGERSHAPDMRADKGGVRSDNSFHAPLIISGAQHNHD